MVLIIDLLPEMTKLQQKGLFDDLDESKDGMFDDVTDRKGGMFDNLEDSKKGLFSGVEDKGSGQNIKRKQKIREGFSGGRGGGGDPGV